MLQRRDAGKGRICFVDVADPAYDPALHAGITFERAMERIHAVEADGTVLTGARAAAGGGRRCRTPAERARVCWPVGARARRPAGSPLTPLKNSRRRRGGVQAAVRGGGPWLGLRGHQGQGGREPGEQVSLGADR